MLQPQGCVQTTLEIWMAFPKSTKPGIYILLLKPLAPKAWWILAVNQPRINYVIFPVKTATLQAASREEGHLRQLPHCHSKQPGSQNSLSFGIFLKLLKNREQMTSWSCVCTPTMNRGRYINITNELTISENGWRSEGLVNASHIRWIKN